MATCNPQPLMDAAKCFAPLPGNQLSVIMVALLVGILKSKDPMADTSPQSLMDAAACFAPLGPGQLQAIQTQLLCEILNAGGSSGNACITSGNADPVDDPTAGCSNAIYTNLVSGSFWYWDPVHSTWVPLIV